MKIDLLRSEICHDVTLAKISEYIPGDVVIAVKNLQARCADHQMDIAVVAFLKSEESAVNVMVMWPPVTEQNLELKEMVRDALSRG